MGRQSVFNRIVNLNSMKKDLLLSFVLIFVSVSVTVAQTVSINNKKFVVNGNASCPIYLNGANTPWESWNDFGGSYSSTKWGQDLVDLKNKGINSTRIWFSCNGAGQPSIASDGTVSAPTAAFWANCDDLFSQAQTNGIYIYATMMSFDHTKTGNPNANNWIAMMSSPAKIQTYINNYLVPFVNRYKTNPYFLSVDLCNEIEWIAENGPGKGDGTNWGASYAVLQQFVGLCAAGLHQTSVARTDGSMVLVTLGSASVKWNGSKVPGGGTNTDGNKWNDANLKAQTSNNAGAYLDFYSPHFYGWMEQYYSSPFEMTPTQYGMDEKPCIVAEMPSRDPMPTPAMSLTTAFNNLKTGGWQGHMPWTANITTNLTTEIGDLADFGAAAQTFTTNNSTLVKPTCTTACATTAPTVSTPVTYCQNATATALTATGTALKWYADNTTTTALSGAPIPVTTATGTTNYYVSQTLSGCEGPRAMIAVTVNGLPTATISTTTGTTFCTGGSVSLNANTGTGLTYKWNNAAGVIAGATSSAYSATTAGSYTVTVTNANNCSATSTATVVTVNAAPTATISTTTGTTFCTGGSVSLNANTGTGLTYKWNNAAGVISGATSSAYSATTAGSYTVTVTNANNCSATSTATVVTVNAAPTATISTTTGTTFCTGGSVSLNANTGTGLTYKWNNAAGVIAGATSSAYSATTAGSYTVTVTNANNCSATSTATVVTVNAAPTATISTTTGTTFCTGGSVSLNANTGTGLTYKWNNAAGVIAGATSSTYSATTAGSYTVTVTNANNCSATSTATVVTVNAAPTATISTTTGTTFCTGGSVSLNANTGTGLTYKWNNAAGVIAGATSSTYSATTAGSYTVTVTNASNCSATSTATVVTVNTAPTATISTTTGTTFCTGGSVSLNANTGTGLTYKWNNAAGVIAGATGSAYSATTAGSYTVTVTNANNCSATSTATVVTVNALPTATISTTTGTTFCTGGSVLLTSSTGSSYQWNNAAGVIAGATSSAYSATTAGSYTVTVTNANNCSATSIATTVTVNALPTATISTTTPTTFCTGGSVALNANTGTGLTYKWNNAAGVIVGATSSAYSATTSGNYTVTVTNANNCSATSTATVVTASAAPVWYQDTDGDGKGDPAVTQTSCTQPAGYVSVAGDGCPSDPNKIAPGVCGCGVAETDTDGDTIPDCVDTDDDNDGVPDTSDCAPLNASIGAATVWYQDTDGDGEGNPAAVETSCTQPAGYVSVAGDDCPNDPNKVAPGICGCGKPEGTCTTTGVQNSLSVTLQIYPNPSESEFTIIAGAGEFTVTCYNASGLEVLKGTYDSEAQMGAELKQGMYLIRIEQGGMVETRKIIKK